MQNTCILTLIVILLFSNKIISGQITLNDDTYDTCSLLGQTYLRTFDSNDQIESCFQTGPRILIDNKWIKVSAHTYLNETSSRIDWLSTKIFIEFYGDIYGLPIAQFSSDALLCGKCLMSCLAQNQIIKMGVDGAIELQIRGDDNSLVAYLYYKRANITLYIRRVSEGYNFGIRQPHKWSLSSSGICVSSCPRPNKQENIICLNDDNLIPAIRACADVLSDLKFMMKNQISRMRICSYDIFMSANSSIAIDHRYALIDDFLINDFYKILEQYVSFTMRQFNMFRYQASIDEMVQNCIEMTMRNNMDDAMLRKIDGMQPNRQKFDQTQQLLTTTSTTTTTTTTTTSTKRPIADKFIDLSAQETVLPKPNPTVDTPKDIPELKIVCETQRQNKIGVFFVAYPANRSIFVQCDELNRAYIKFCPYGTMFTAKMLCEPAEMSSSQNPLITNKTPLNNLDSLLRPRPQENFAAISKNKLITITNDNIPNPCNDTNRMRNLYFFPHPYDTTKYVQCDDFNNYAIGQCVQGTKFSAAARGCERLF